MILVTGDTYIDSPFIGIAVVGKILTQAGYRVGVIAQPALDYGRGHQPVGRAAPVLGGIRRQH